MGRTRSAGKRASAVSDWGSQAKTEETRNLVPLQSSSTFWLERRLLNLCVRPMEEEISGKDPPAQVRLIGARRAVSKGQNEAGAYTLALLLSLPATPLPFGLAGRGPDASTATSMPFCLQRRTISPRALGGMPGGRLPLKTIHWPGCAMARILSICAARASHVEGLEEPQWNP